MCFRLRLLMFVCTYGILDWTISESVERGRGEISVDRLSCCSRKFRKHEQRPFEVFVKVNKDELEKKSTAFFTVNVVARKKEKNQPDTNPYMKKFLELSGWQPDKLAVFAGRIDYPSYRFLDRLIIRFIMLITKGPTDTSQTYEFTDWNKVANFAKEVL